MTAMPFAFLVAIPVTFASLAACAGDMCGNTIVIDLKSPDHLHRAIMFQRDCGATTGFTTQVSILGAGDSLVGSGNTYVADDDHGKARAGDWGGPWTQIEWRSADHVVVRYAPGSRVFHQAAKVGGVRVTYEAADMGLAGGPVS